MLTTHVSRNAAVGEPSDDTIDVKPVNKARYWFWKGKDSLEIVDVANVDLVEVIERSKPWDDLGIFKACAVCEQLVGGYCMYCCQCPKFTVCRKCTFTTEYFDLLRKSHGGHEMLVIQYRPLRAPLYHGGDLPIFERFLSASTADEFYAFYPWLLHDVPGMEQIHIRTRDLLLRRLSARSDIQQGSTTWNWVHDSYQFPTDWFIRFHKCVHWQAVHAEASQVVRDRLPGAKLSVSLFRILRRLQIVRGSKEAGYGQSDIKPTARALKSLTALNQGVGNDEFRRAHNDYVLYRLPVDVLGEFNRTIHLSQYEYFLPSIESMRTLDKSQPKNLESIFLCLMEHLPGSSDLQRQSYIEADLYFGIDDSPELLFAVKPQWMGFVKSHLNIRGLCRSHHYNQMPMIDSVDAVFLASRSHVVEAEAEDLLSNVLEDAKYMRLKGDYVEAESLLRSVDRTDARVALSLQRVYQDQGYINRLSEWYGPIGKIETKSMYIESKDIFEGLNLHLPETYKTHGDLTLSSAEASFLASSSVARDLMRLITTYENCFTRGRWDRALEVADTMCEKYLARWRLPAASAENPTYIVYMEIFYHRILLAVLRDQHMSFDPSGAITRLTVLRDKLLDMNLLSEAWDVLQTQLEISKESFRSQYLEDEATLSVHVYLYSSSIALDLLQSFLSHPLFFQRDFCKIEWARANSVLAEIFWKTGVTQQATKFESIASKVFEEESCFSGLADITIATYERTQPVEYSRIQSLYQSLVQHKDIGRQRRLRRIGVVANIQRGPAWEWQFRQRSSMANLASEAGDNIAHQRWRLRKYAADTLAASIIQESEDVLSSASETQSALLGTMASFNLATAYLTQGNILDAATSAFLHYTLTSIQDDAEQRQRGVLLLLKTFKAAFKAQPAIHRDAIKLITSLWSGWLDGDAPKRWLKGEIRGDELDRFVDGACFIPVLLGMMPRPSLGEFAYIDETIFPMVLGHLRLAFDLASALPLYASHLTLPRLATALGAVATYAGNKELACRAYDEGLRLCHSGDFWTRACLQLEAGKLMTYLASEDPEHWMHVVSTGRSLLEASYQGFLRSRYHQGAFINICVANLALLKSYVDEVLGRQVSWMEVIFQKKDILDDQQKQEREDYLDKAGPKLGEVAQKGWFAFHFARHIMNDLTRRLKLSSRYENARNIRFLVSRDFSDSMFELAFELGLIKVKYHYPGMQDPYKSFWQLMQMRKATIVQRQTQEFRSASMLEQIRQNENALNLYQQEQELILDGKHATSDQRLEDHWQLMEEIPILKRLQEQREGHGATLESLKPLENIARDSLDVGQDLVLVDWARFRTAFVICGYDITNEKFLFCEIIYDCTVEDVELWVTEHLGTNDPRDTLRRSNVFHPLFALVEPLHKNVKPGSLLAFSPSDALHSIPLHAIPYKHENDYPVIFYHPVVYCPSAAVLVNVVERSMLARREGFRATFLGRYGASNQQAETDIQDALTELDSQFSTTGAKTTLITGANLTRKSLSTHLPTSHLIHYQGHVDGDQLSQHLVLESDQPAGTILPPTASGEERYRIQDVFAISIPPALVMLLACASGQQDIGGQDDALGLLTAFFAAGASSVVATFWPIDNSFATGFSREFYSSGSSLLPSPTKGGKEDIEDVTQGMKGFVNYAKAAQTAIIKLRAARGDWYVDGEEHDDPCEVWEWAGFALHGSWIGRGIEGETELRQALDSLSLG